MTALRFALIQCLATVVVLAGTTAHARSAADTTSFNIQGASPPIVATTSAPISSLDPRVPREIEANDTAATATPIDMSDDQYRIQGTIDPIGDVDYYVFFARAGDRVDLATITASSVASTDTVIDLIASDGVTVIESDDNDGSQTDLASSISGRLLPSAGNYFVRVREQGDDARVLPYVLFARLQRDAPSVDIEPNDDVFTQQTLGDGRLLVGTVGGADTRDQFALRGVIARGFLVAWLDLDPDRDGVVSQARLRFEPPGGPGVDPVFEFPEPTFGSSPVSRVLIYPVAPNGTNTSTVVVESEGLIGGDYRLSLASFPPPVSPPDRRCTTVSDSASTTIADGGELRLHFTFLPFDPRPVDGVTLNTFVQGGEPGDFSYVLRSPSGIEVPLLRDLPPVSNRPFGNFFDDRALMPGVPTQRGLTMPQDGARLSWFNGSPPNGIWTLIVRDKPNQAARPMTISAFLGVCEQPPPPACPINTEPYVAYATPFEDGDAGFSHSGRLDQWQRGQPSGGLIASCASGNACWKTNLTGDYAPNSDQNLISPPIDLRILTGPILVNWAQNYQLQSADHDNFVVDAQRADGSAGTRLFEHIDGDMATFATTPRVDSVAGWSQQRARVDEFAGQSMRLRFHLDSDAATQLAGAAIDDVSVTGCRSTVATDASVAISDGLTVIPVPSGQVEYRIVASNAGPADSPANLTVTFGVGALCTWTATYAGGASGPDAGSGDIAATLNLPLNAQAFFTARCDFPERRVGTTETRATLTTGGTVSDVNLANNTASDINTFDPAPDAVFSDGFE